MFDKEEKSLKERAENLAEQLILETINTEELSEFPNGYFPEAKTIYLHLNGGSVFCHDLRRNVRCPYYMKGNYSNSITIPTSKISKKSENEAFEIERLRNFLSQKKKESRDEIKAILYSVNTLNQLKNIWPDVIKFIDIQDEVKATTELAPIVSKYNRMLK